MDWSGEAKIVGSFVLRQGDGEWPFAFSTQVVDPAKELEGSHIIGVFMCLGAVFGEEGVQAVYISRLVLLLQRSE